MRKSLFAIAAFAAVSSFAQNSKIATPSSKSPKLVVGIVVDQMRWDYLYRFYDVYKTNGGFKRLLDKGFSCDNTFVPYLPTVTACGHASVYTGSVPAINGITGNTWWDSNLARTVYCTEDKSVQAIGNNKAEDGQMSPKNLLVTTVMDQLKLATNFRSKTIGISMKDRGAILPAGHAADAAYWYDGKCGNFITSSFYMKALPAWLQKFNEGKMVDSFYQKDWDLFLDRKVYQRLCDTNYSSYVKHKIGTDSSTLPYSIKQYAGKDYSRILNTPYGNDVLGELAKKLIAAEQMGKHETTDFLAVSFSSTDYIGHDFGPNSWEILDTYARLDATLGNLLDYLDKTVGTNQYTVFLTADHAAPHVPEFLNKHNMPGGRLEDGTIKKELNDYLKKETGVSKLVNYIYQFNIHLNHAAIDSAKLDEASIKASITKYLLKKEEVIQVVDKQNPTNVPEKIRQMVVNGNNPQRGGDLVFITKAGVLSSGKLGISHGLWNNDDSHIPLLFYGWGIKQGKLKRETYMTDISATVAALLNIQMPSGCVGKVIEEVLK